jgi:hypothetical protein
MKLAASILATALCAVLPLTAIASDHGGGGGSHASSGGSGGSHSSGGSGGSHSSGGGGSHAASPARSAPAPVSRPAPDVRPEPIARPQPVTRTQPVARTQPATPTPPINRIPLGPTQRRAPFVPPSKNIQPIPNPNNYRAWDWNGGEAWIGYSAYWGNGFWGPLAYGLSAAAYLVAEGSPGAKLLHAYSLTQTPCGPPNLVEIFGPDGTEICAFPNALVAPGQYYVDPDTLTLYSGPPQN